MAFRSAIKSMVLVLCLLVSFQARANWWDNLVEWLGDHFGSEETNSGSNNNEQDNHDEESDVVILNYAIYIEGHEEMSGSVRSDESTPPIEFSINKGQFFNVKASCRYDATDENNIDNDHADDFEFSWTGTGLTSWGGEIDDVYYAYGFVTVSADESADTYGFTVRCFPEGERPLNSQSFEVTLNESELVVEATPETVETEEGESSTITVKFWGDVDGCTELPSDAVDASEGVEMYCPDTLSTTIYSSSDDTSGITVSMDIIKFYKLKVFLIGSPSKYYQTTADLTGVTAGSYTIDFVVKGDGYWGQEATDSVTVTVTEPEVEVEVEEEADVEPEDDADGDGYTEAQNDCDDTKPEINPGEQEVCDEIDNNCDGNVDGGGVCDETDVDVDADADGYTVDVDCDDSNPNINPGAADDCTNLVDMNCDGLVSHCDVIMPVPDPGTPVVQNVDIDGQVLGGADVTEGCGCVMTGNVNPYQLSTLVVLALSLLSGGMFRFFGKK